MKRRPVEWLQGPSDKSDWDTRRLEFTVAGQWVAVDADQLILPIRVQGKYQDDEYLVEISDDEEGYIAILKQYGGEGLLNDMLMSDQDLEQGSRWILWRRDGLLTVEPDPD